MPPLATLPRWRARDPLGAEDPFPDIDGDSAEIRRLKHHMLLVAHDPDVTVLVLGESGTGKERVAHAIHRLSPRHRFPFVVVNCAGLSATLVEDELFGHVRGAFTGAVEDRPGPFERASGGTIFLDEVGDLTGDLQMKLLRALQERTVQRLGSARESAFDIRAIAATHVDLGRAVEHGRFREDLYYRLNVYELTVPPLRRRAGDIAALTSAILLRLSERRRRAPATVDPDVLDLFRRHNWPGNVRELENTLERMLVAAGGATYLTIEHLPDGLLDERRRRRLGERADAQSIPRARPSPADALAALERNGFDCRRTAMELGLSRHQLYRLRKRLTVDPRSAGAG